MELRSQTAGRTVLQAEARPAFEDGTALLFSQWTALELAVENEWGGRSSRQKADQLIAEALDWFYSRKEHYADDLEVLLDQAMDEDFSVQLEDGSAILVAKQLVKWHEACLRGDFSELPRLRAEQQRRHGSAASRPEQVNGADGGSSSGDDSDEDEDGSGSEADDMETDEVPAADSTQRPQQQQRAPPVVDDEGFQLVQRKGRR